MAFLATEGFIESNGHTQEAGAIEVGFAWLAEPSITPRHTDSWHFRVAGLDAFAIATLPASWRTGRNALSGIVESKTQLVLSALIGTEAIVTFSKFPRYVVRTGLTEWGAGGPTATQFKTGCMLWTAPCT